MTVPLLPVTDAARRASWYAPRLQRLGTTRIGNDRNGANDSLQSSTEDS